MHTLRSLVAADYRGGLIKTRQPKPTAWGERAGWRLKKLAQEAGQSDERHDELVALLEAVLRSLRDGDTDAEQVAA